jgi:hypothetical protein
MASTKPHIFQNRIPLQEPILAAVSGILEESTIGLTAGMSANPFASATKRVCKLRRVAMQL